MKLQRRAFPPARIATRSVAGRPAVVHLVLVRSMSVQLRPSFFRCAAWMVAIMLVLAVITYFWEGYRENHWWTRDYMLSMLIPFVIGPLAVWFVFVPSRLA